MFMADIEKDFLTECKEDYVGLWVLVRAYREAKPEISTDSIRTEVLSLLSKLLKENKIIAGNPNASGEFVKWELSEEECVNQIEMLWSSLGREPDIGDIVWLTSFE